MTLKRVTIYLATIPLVIMVVWVHFTYIQYWESPFVTPYVPIAPIVFILATRYGRCYGIYTMMLSAFVTEFWNYPQPISTPISLGRIAILVLSAGIIGYMSDKMREEKRKAEAANKAKTNFLGMLSHELRTPLNAIIGFSDLMLEMPDSMSEVQIENLRRISRAGHHLFCLVTELLNLSAIEAGKVQLKYSTVELDAFIKEIALSFSTYVQTKNITLNYSSKVKSWFFDRTRIHEVINNLVCNAVKYTEEGGSITLSASPHHNDNNNLAISVEDTGVGISEQDLKRIFEPFEQIRPSTQGVGLGLSICQRMVSLHRGHIEVSSKLGGGSIFTVVLPPF